MCIDRTSALNKSIYVIHIMKGCCGFRTQDTAFSWNDLMLKHNTELLNNFGNFIYRYVNRMLPVIKVYAYAPIQPDDLVSCC